MKTFILNTDYLLERLRRRIDPSEYDKGYCDNCGATLTASDREAGECTQCHAVIDVDDEGNDEDLADDGYGDY